MGDNKTQTDKNGWSSTHYTLYENADQELLHHLHHPMGALN